jgi:hypothetical protein
MGKKSLLIVIGLAVVLASVVLLMWRRNKPGGASVSERSRLTGSPAYEVHIEQPLVEGRAPWEIPGIILGVSERGPRFDQASPGAKSGNVAPNHLELSAEGGWDLLIETDSEGKLASGTHVAFPIKLGGRPYIFNCRPADTPIGYLNATARAGSDEIDGRFELEVIHCKNVVSGKTAAWPYRPLKIVGSFGGLRTATKKDEGGKMN